MPFPTPAITGAAGGVGRYAVQLAALGGAHVITSVESLTRADGLAKLGAHQVVVGLDGIDRPVDLILDNAGGPQLAAAWELLTPGGAVQNIGWASGEPAVFAVGPDLATLLEFVAAGRLSPEVDRRGSWEGVAEAAQALLDRRIAGKVVLDVQPAAAN